MKKKWSSDKVKEVQRWMIKRWPETFTQGPDLRPLSLQIHKELLNYRDENPQLSGRVVREVLKRHTTSYGYLYGLAKNEHRYDLESKPVGKVAPEHRAWARETLRAKQKLAQKVRKDAKKKLQEERKGPARMALKKAAGEARSVSPVIRYKPTRRRLVKPESEGTVDLLAS